MTAKITRRDFLKTSGLLAAGAALAACRPQVGTETAAPVGPSPPQTPWPTTEPADEALLAHTLRRISWGPTPEMFERARSLGLDAYIEEQLHPETLDDSEVESLLGNFETLTMTPGERDELEKRAQPVQELIGATLLRQWRSPRQLYEVVVDFWSNHFNIFIGKNQCRVLKTDDDLDVIRPNALGKFADLLSASAHSPAMLVYLDQASSSKRAPNENYARELMELHTISVDGGYSHDDIIEVARAFTGWSVAGRRDVLRKAGSFLFRRQMHDDGKKQVMDLTIPAGGGEEDGHLILDYLGRHEMTARFISAKLARRFVADEPPASLAAELSQTFMESGGDTREMLRVLFRSDEFRNSAGQKVKRPLEFFISALRVANARIGSRSRALVDYLRQLGQVPFFWSPPTGYPDAADWWMTTSGLLGRWNFGLLLAAGMIRGAEVDLESLTADAASPQDVVDVLSIRFLGEKLPGDARDILVDFASQGDLGDNLAGVAGLIMGSPHFQVR